MESDNRLSYKSLSFALLLVVGMCAAPSIAATTNKKDVTPIEQKIKDFPIKGKKGKASSRSYEVSVPAGSVGDYNVSISLDIDWKELGKETWMWIKSASRTMFSDHSVKRDVVYVSHNGKKYPVAIIPITADRNGSGKRITGNLDLSAVFGKGEIPYRVFISADKARRDGLKCLMKKDNDWASDTTWGHGKVVRNGDVIPSWGGARERYLVSRGGNWGIGDSIIVVRADMPIDAFKKLGKVSGIHLRVERD